MTTLETPPIVQDAGAPEHRRVLKTGHAQLDRIGSGREVEVSLLCGRSCLSGQIEGSKTQSLNPNEHFPSCPCTFVCPPQLVTPSILSLDLEGGLSQPEFQDNKDRSGPDPQLQPVDFVASHHMSIFSRSLFPATALWVVL
jgi:hypothetical protein